MEKEKIERKRSRESGKDIAYRFCLPVFSNRGNLRRFETSASNLVKKEMKIVQRNTLESHRNCNSSEGELSDKLVGATTLFATENRTLDASCENDRK